MINFECTMLSNHSVVWMSVKFNINFQCINGKFQNLIMQSNIVYLWPLENAYS